MPIRKVPFAPDEFYHLYNRGNSRQIIYKTAADYDRFMSLLYLANGTTTFNVREIEEDVVFDFERGEQQVAIGAYCLMPNHFHILVTPLVEDGVTNFMKKLTGGYSSYFNKKQHRTGSLYEGRFKSEYVDNDNYLKYLFSYIHLNPVKLIQLKWQQEGIADVEMVLQYLQDYKYSSYPDNSLIRPESAILNRAPFPEYFSSKAAYDDEMREWLSYDDEDL